MYASVVAFSDTGSPTHVAAISKELARRPLGETGLLLKLPSRWVPLAVELVPGQGWAKLPADNHWARFAALFGDVLTAEVASQASPESEGEVGLLVHFADGRGARAMCEALTRRYLYNPQNRSFNDTLPVHCDLGNPTWLRRAALGTAAAPEVPVPEAPVQLVPCFRLNRCGATTDRTAGPDFMQLTPSSRVLVVGRENCDVILRRPHISKVHARLEMRMEPSNGEWVLLIQDTSANGTWVNDQRLDGSRGGTTHLRPGDLVSFLPKQHSFYADALLYEVFFSTSSDKLVGTQAPAMVGRAAGRDDAALATQGARGIRRRGPGGRPAGAGAGQGWRGEEPTGRRRRRRRPGGLAQRICRAGPERHDGAAGHCSS